MYLRFITRFRDSYEEECTGVFQAAYYLRRSDMIDDFDEQYLNELLTWFEVNLRKPSRFHKSRRRNAMHVSLSWFKSTSTEHVQKLYEIIWILDKYGMTVERVKRRNTGYILYEDEHQVSSIPHSRERKLVL